MQYLDKIISYNWSTKSYIISWLNYYPLLASVRIVGNVPGEQIINLTESCEDTATQTSKSTGEIIMRRQKAWYFY